MQELSYADTSYDVNLQAVEVLDHGFVRLDSFMADDLSVVNSARVSYGTRHNKLEESDVGLIGFLMSNRHGTPFEHNSFRFHVKAPIFIFREWQRHRIGSFSELSARYKRLEGEFYIPDVKNVRTRIGKPGHYTFEPLNEGAAYSFIQDLRKRCEMSFDMYEGHMQTGVCPEQARFFLHVNTYSEMYWTVSARSLMNFLSLRNAPQAQWEIQQYASVVEQRFKEVMPITYDGFIRSGRAAP